MGEDANKISENDIKEAAMHAVESRRTKVFDLHFMRGISCAAIAKALKVHVNTIYKDIKALKKDLKNMVKTSDIDELCGEVIRNLQNAYREAWLQYTMTSNVSERQKYFDLYLKAHKELYTFLMDVGLIKRAPTKQEIEYTSKKIREMSDDELDDYMSGLMNDIGISAEGFDAARSGRGIPGVN